MSSFDEGSGDETGALVPSGGSGRRQQLVRLRRLEWAFAVREHPPLTPRVCARDSVCVRVQSLLVHVQVLL